MKKLENRLRKNIRLDEKYQLENLKKYKILYSKTESVFDQLAAFTATMLNTPIALINFIDRSHVWKNADKNRNQNASLPEAESNLCSMAIINENAGAFKQFAESPELMSNALIAGESGLKFYAAAPITNNEGVRVGTVCILDKKYRQFSTYEQQQLDWVAAVVAKEMNKKNAGSICA
ncbi:GAF domain-containing protein [Pedobacter africanus]|uniref:GAF domain-containing protein n=1 Tax=Pedobacter africanus TaxID=151894 RepID=A0ACC6L4B2_9SPHI|nr:GAF domain-containing protein [Pedobacter africanus]MDR6786260.1 GAF domain-containing protein [Pedobacter africanus]